jgi:hypothetical protein
MDPGYSWASMDPGYFWASMDPGYSWASMDLGTVDGTPTKYTHNTIIFKNYSNLSH